MVYVIREEIGSLEVKVDRAKEAFLHTVDEAKEGTVAMLPGFEVNDRFLLNQDEAWYTLSIEVQVPLDVVVLQVSRCKLGVAYCETMWTDLFSLS